MSRFFHTSIFPAHPEQLLCQRRQNLLQLLHVLLHHRVRVDPGHDAKAMAPVPVQYPDKIHVRPAVVHARDHLQRCHRILCAP